MIAAGRRLAPALIVLASLSGLQAPARAATLPLPPSPQDLLGVALLGTPPLDPMPACAGAELDPAAARRLATAISGRPRAAAEPASLEREQSAQLITAVVEARRASDATAWLRAHALLDPLVAAPGPQALRACGYYELGRLELLLGRYPEASASVARAASLHPAVASARSFFEASTLAGADALYLAGRRAAAFDVFRSLVGSEDRRISGAAHLRILDVKFDAGRVAEALPAYTALLDRPERVGASPGGWGARVVEAALAAGDAATARRWLQRLVVDPPSEASARLFAIRLADVLAAGDELPEARRLLREIESGHAGTPFGDLATVRRLALPQSPGESPAAADVQSLETIVGRAPAPLSFYARVVLGERLLELGRIDEALPLLVDAVFQAERSPVSPHAEVALDGALEVATRNEDCGALLRRIGASRGYLVRTARRPDPFLRIGACYEALGVPGVALEVYRGLTRRFGSEVAESVSLPVARSSFALGRQSAARSAAEARVARGGADLEWVRLLARIRLAEGDAAGTKEMWSQLVEQESSASRRLEAAIELARTSLATPSDAPRRRLLFETLSRAEGPEAADAEAYVLALRLTARLHRRDGDTKRAHALYELAAAHDRSGAVAYWLGRLDADSERSRESFSRASGEGTGLYARLAAHRLGLDRLQTALGPGREPGRHP